MTAKRFTIFQDYYDDLYIQDKEVYHATGIKVGNEEDVKYKNVSKIVELLNELHEENQLLKCALALDGVDYIIAEGKKIDIPPYYEFEQRYDSVMHRREYDGYD